MANKLMLRPLSILLPYSNNNAYRYFYFFRYGYLLRRWWRFGSDGYGEWNAKDMFLIFLYFG